MPRAESLLLALSSLCMMSDIQHNLNKWDILNTSVPVVFPHGTLADGSDLEILRENNQFIAITPKSEHHWVHGQLFTSGIMEQSGLGIDTSFTSSSDILTQMWFQLQSTRNTRSNPAHLHQKLPNNTVMTVKQAFLLGTPNGGLALRRPDFGVIKKGAKADIVVLNSNNTAFSAYYDPIAAVVLHANVGDIGHVLADGRFVKRDFHLRGYDWRGIQTNFTRSTKKIQQVPLGYQNKYGTVRAQALSQFGLAEDTYENVATVNVEPSKL
ncbi:hypothetical protein BGW38_000352 [Lunasporangiospora selenospora]|uniref:Amidohydrolase-related domain-containing protein n=1 Tax=Lunasporangiospora selenospora TaxID=979761 RepID=A0A9P6FX41_9FUNG|nr:hypothetical protein BGW38_000352 [Lunasporangiospora selenospora]